MDAIYIQTGVRVTMKDRPTCETCPFYSKDDIEPSHARTGHCHRLSPTYKTHLQHPAEAWHPSFPLLTDDNWCGEHPKFPAYLASLD